MYLFVKAYLLKINIKINNRIQMFIILFLLPQIQTNEYIVIVVISESVHTQIKKNNRVYYDKQIDI